MYAFTTAKSERASDENEDAMTVLLSFSASGKRVHRVVVLDGKTMSCHPRHFARAAALSLAIEDRFDRAAELGTEAWDAYMEDREVPAHWAVPGQLARGPACTALTVTTGSDGLIRAAAIGDCCLFITQAGRFFDSFPLRSLSDFQPAPDELAPVRNNGKPRRVYRGSVRLCPSCVELFAMTDELARYVFRELAAGEQPFHRLKVRSNAEFLDLVNEVRRSQEAADDDMTLVWWAP